MISRRHSLAMLAKAGTALAMFGPRVALARAATEKRFVFVILRGALDGLAAVPAYGDPAYRSARGALACAEPGQSDGALDLDGRFGLHPALQPLQAMYQAREMLVVHAVATPYRARSHFDAQDLLENGTARPRGAADGWLNRSLGLLGGGRSGDQRLGLAVGQTVPLVLRGTVPVGAWAPQQLPELNGDFLSRLAALYAPDPVLGPAIREGLRAQAMTDSVLRDGEGGGRMAQGGNGARGPRSVAAAAQAVGRLLAAPQGARVAVIEIGGWDTHAGQGVLTGRLAPVLRMLADGLAALKTALGPAWRETVVAVATEFGRTVAPNGTNGTDHGTASAAFLLGGAVAGGRVAGPWPGLAADRLLEGRDLAPMTDLTAVLKAVLVGHLGLPLDAVDRVVFPDSAAVRPLPDLLRM